MTAPRKIVVFLPNWIGDVVMATPCLRALRHRFPHDELIGIVQPYAADVLTGTPWLTRTIQYARRSKTPALNSWGLVKLLRRERIDHCILLTNSLRTGLMAWLSGAKQRTGYARDLRSWFLNDRLTAPRNSSGKYQPISAVDYYLQIAQHLGCTLLNRDLELECTAEDTALSNQVWDKLQLQSASGVVALHAAGGWGGTATAKAWPVEHFALVAKKIVANYGHQVLVLCGPNEREAAREIVRLSGSTNVKSLADATPSIGLTKGCLKKCQLLVSTDSGPRHIATALGIPTIGLFGATDPRWAETYHARGEIIFNKLPCGPCAKKHCPLGHHDCMRQISVEQVFAMVQQQLNQAATAAA